MGNKSVIVNPKALHVYLSLFNKNRFFNHKVLFKIKSFYDSSDRISAVFTKVNEMRFQEYVNACKDMGFTVEAAESSDYYDAFNEEGYHLQLDRYSGQYEMDMYLTAPIPMSRFSWPDTETGRMVPAPPETYGRIEWEDENGFCIYVGNMTREDFSQYADACRSAGFSADFRKDADSFYAENDRGYSLSIGYEGFQTVCIYLSGNAELDP